MALPNTPPGTFAAFVVLKPKCRRPRNFQDFDVYKLRLTRREAEADADVLRQELSPREGSESVRVDRRIVRETRPGSGKFHFCNATYIDALAITNLLMDIRHDKTQKELVITNY